MAEIRLEGVSKSFGTVNVIDDLSLTVNSGELVVFLGPSGSGKSTLLRMIAGLETIDSGALTIGGERYERLPPSPAQRRHCVPELCALSAYERVKIWRSSRATSTWRRSRFACGTRLASWRWLVAVPSRASQRRPPGATFNSWICSREEQCAPAREGHRHNLFGSSPAIVERRILAIQALHADMIKIDHATGRRYPLAEAERNGLVDGLPIILA